MQQNQPWQLGRVRVRGAWVGVRPSRTSERKAAGVGKACRAGGVGRSPDRGKELQVQRRSLPTEEGEEPPLRQTCTGEERGRMLELRPFLPREGNQTLTPHHRAPLITDPKSTPAPHTSY